MKNNFWGFYYSQVFALLIMTTYLVNALLRQDLYWILTSSFGVIAVILGGAFYSYLLRKYRSK
jgi:CDP-diglyceride synthetase